MKKFLALLTLVTAFTASSVATAVAAPSVVYDATPSPTPPNVASLGYQATSTSEFGDSLHLGGTARVLEAVKVTMSTWARYSEYSADPAYDASGWSHPITVNVYDDSLDGNGVPDTLLASTTESASIPWRPEGDPSCPDTGYGPGFAYKASDGNCYNGKAFDATFDLSASNVVLPSDVIVGIAYDSQSYGADPIGSNGPYNSLNVGVPANQTVSVGADDDPDAVFWDTTYPGYAAGFREDTGWTPNGTVALQITASASSPTSKDQCKKGGWMTLSDDEGNAFKNQGDCVSYVATDGKNSGAIPPAG